MTRYRSLAATVAVSALVLSGCTGIPGSSMPSTVETLRVANGANDTPTQPQPGALPRAIVSDFLDANAVDSGKHTGARAFLTPTARNQWSDQRVTVIADRQVKTYNADKHSLLVTGRVVGTINADGIYTPSLQGNGHGGKPVPFPFKVRKAKGQYRIDELRSGLLITADQFSQTYQQHTIYYPEIAGKYLVPDVRWTSIPAIDSAALATWLMDRLVGAPRPDLQDVVSTDTFPAQADSTHVLVRSEGASTVVEIPGSSQLDPSVQNRLAVQLAHTLGEALPGGTFTITDGGKPVMIPAAGSTSFAAGSLDTPIRPTDPGPTVYYLRDGRIVNENGHHISGPLGSGRHFLTSIAVARGSGGNGPLSVAATEAGASDAKQRLVIGTQKSGVKPTSVHGKLTRPVWAPGQSEVWIGVGSDVHRVKVGSKTTRDSVVQVPPTAGGGPIVSLSFSPDGSRVALVVAGTAGKTARLYVGTVVRDAGTVRLSALTQVSPAGVVVTGAAWSNAQRLIVIGYFASSKNGDAFETGVDGSLWTSRGIDKLPSPPVNITASTSGAAWVESDGQVWKQSGLGWVSASSTGQAPGNEPVYVS